MILGTPVHVSLNGDDRMLRRTFGFFPCCPHMHWWVRPPLSPSSVQLHILKLDFNLPPSKINWSRGSSLQPAPSLNCLRLFLVLVLQKEVNLWFNLMRDRHIEQQACQRAWKYFLNRDSWLRMSANSKKRGQCEKNILLLKHWPVVPEIRKLNVYLAERCRLSKVKKYESRNEKAEWTNV